MARPAASAVLLLVVPLAACGGDPAVATDGGPGAGEGNALMAPGQGCLGCHASGQSAASAPFTVAGTLYPAALAAADGGLAGGTVNIVDANGQTLRLSSNAAGNFYSVAPLVFPIQVSTQISGATFTMQQSPPNGDCNACHALQAETLAPLPPIAPGFSSSPGRVYAFAADGGCGTSTTSCPSQVPSFSRQVQPLLAGNCLPCHLGASRCASAALGTSELCGMTPELDSYATIAGSDFSYTLDCSMPAAAAYQISPDSLRIVADWLSCGAPNN